MESHMHTTGQNVFGKGRHWILKLLGVFFHMAYKKKKISF